jgi:hypothetical protein
MKSFPVICALGFLGSLILGWTIRSGLHPTTGDAGPAPDGALSMAAVDGASPIARSAKAPTGVPAEAGAEPEAPELSLREKLHGSRMLAIPEATLASLKINALHSDGTLSAQIVDILSLDEAEVERVNNVMADAAGRLRALELERMEVINSSADELVLFIPAFEHEGLEAEAALRARLVRELGERDGALLADFACCLKNR